MVSYGIACYCKVLNGIVRSELAPTTFFTSCCPNLSLLLHWAWWGQTQLRHLFSKAALICWTVWVSWQLTSSCDPRPSGESRRKTFSDQISILRTCWPGNAIGLLACCLKNFTDVCLSTRETQACLLCSLIMINLHIDQPPLGQNKLSHSGPPIIEAKVQKKTEV